MAAQNGLKDFVFTTIPFEQWLVEGNPAHIRWTTRISDAELGNHQRLGASLEVVVDGAELAKRRGEGEFVIMMQFTDAKGTVWQDHESVDLGPIPEAMKRNDAVYVRNFMVLPGDYQVAFAVYDTATGEHAATKRRFHVPALRNDPFPGAWKGLPAIEFIRLAKPPDTWYLPSVRNRLSLAAEARRPLEIEILVNLTPSERASASTRARNRNLSVLLPALKTLSQISWGQMPVRVTLLDLSRQRVAFEQENVRRLNWRQARASLAEINPGMIDVKALENRKSNARFFAAEVGRRLAGGAGAAPKVVIVLSSPTGFEAGQDLRPVEAVARRDGSKLFYFRYQPAVPVGFAGGGRAGARRGADGVLLPPRSSNGPLSDDLAPLLKPLDPRLYDVTSPMEFRRALANMLAEIGRL